MSVTINGTTGVNTDQLTVTGRGYNPPEALTDAASIAWDWSAIQSAEVTITANRTLANPTNAVSGQYAALRVARTSSFILSFGSSYKGLANVSQSQIAGQVDHFVFRYNGSVYELVSFKANVGG